jgi:hypothetical protein
MAPVVFIDFSPLKPVFVSVAVRKSCLRDVCSVTSRYFFFVFRGDS